MSKFKPTWHSLLEGVPAQSTSEVRSDLSATVRLIEQNGTRILLHTYDAPRAALVPLTDLALLQALDQHPELLEQLKTLVPK